MSRAAPAYTWRAVALAGLVVGLALAAPLDLGASGGATKEVGSRAGFSALAALAIVLAVARPRPGGAGTRSWLVLVLAAAGLWGLSIGSARLAAIDAGALMPEAGERIELTGTVATAPRTSGDATRFTLDAAEGRIAVETREASVFDEGSEVLLGGTVREPASWEHAQVERSGASRVLVADRIETTGAARGGLRGALDDVRRRAELALERGTEPVASALLRGFVLGQDDRIPEDVRDDFRRSGLAHVLAVSGQNVMLLAILATPLLALAGVPLRTRLVAIALIIAIYVPVAGAGASIQRAGAMGIAGVVASLASRPAARWYALGVAAAVTLGIDPRATGDIGWQLSFCAVAGLLILAPPLIRLLAPDGTGIRRALAEGAAMTLAASLSTAPLAAHHFGTVSVTALPANLIAMPAIAPAMWLGMLSGAAGQIPGAPVEALTWLGGLCSGFIAWVAHALGPEWAQLDVPEPGPAAALVWTAVLVGGARLACLALERRRALAPAPRPPRRRVIVAAVGLSSVAAAIGFIASGDGPPSRPPALTIRILDVGQGDSILIQPRRALPFLIDTGPPDAAADERLADLDVNELAAIAVTHDELDHAGGLASVLEEVEVGHLLTAQGAPRSCHYLDCPPTTRIAAGSRFRVGAARVEVLWPPPSAPPAANPNETALVLRLTLGDFDALLTADAEAEAAIYGSGPVEFLKVAHHGSADPGLEDLLGRTSPGLAAISVGADNPYGHPAPETTAALAAHDVPLLRTDTGGEIVIEVDRDGWGVGG